MNHHKENLRLIVLTTSEASAIIKDEVRKVVQQLLEESTPSPSYEQEELLNVNEVAALLKTTPQNVHAKKRNGQIPFVRLGGRILFKRSEVIASLASIRIRSSKKPASL